MASTSLPLATAAAVATLFAAPAGAAPNDQPTTPPTPAPAQPGVNESPSTPETTQPEPNKPESKQDPQKPESKPTPRQPGVTTPEPDADPDHAMPDQKDPRLSKPTQPGVTPPRVAPLPVPGQQKPSDPQAAVTPDQAAPQPGPQAAPQPGQQAAPQQGTESDNAEARQPESSTLVQPQAQPRWQAPRMEAAPAAPVVEMTGPHAEIGANVDGGTLLPGHVANTHHFSNEAGYVGTIGYRTPTGAGEAGVSVEFVDKNTVKLTTYTGGEGLASNNTTAVFDTTQLNQAKAAVEDWIREQPGGAAALEAAAQVKLPLQPGDFAPQTAEVGGVTTQWGGSLQY
ncbi:hypothetical protein [Nocardia gipuzkoensis]|uniref:hypothetical protein n=1 Tax=Nocardia gipuzkoensis TaxID=2749991 RepID=UPI001C675DF0|nr:hypothetical protein [Nocardia gipuzkoensis]